MKVLQNNKVEEEENEKKKLECRKKNGINFLLPFYKESQRDIYQYRWSSTSYHNATKSHIL